MNSVWQPFFSVVVCAFNEEKLLRACLEGLTSQTYPHDQYEVLVIDDESTDRTFEIASEIIATLGHEAPRVSLIRIQHGGLSVARNSGVQMSEGDVIAFIDGDAVPDSTWLEELSKPFMVGGDYVGGRIDLLNTGSWVARFMQRTRNRQFFGPHIANDQFVGCNMAFRKEVFDLVGGFHENFISRGDESTLYERIRDRFQYVGAPNAVVLHERPNTIIKSVRVEWKSATLSHLVAKAHGKQLHWKSVLLFIEQCLITVFPALIGLVLFSPAFFVLPLIVATSAVFRRFYLRPLNRAIALGLIADYGFLRGTIGHIAFCFTNNMIGFIGRLVSPLLHWNDNIIQPLTTEITILQLVTNKSKRISA